METIAGINPIPLTMDDDYGLEDTIDAVHDDFSTFNKKMGGKHVVSAQCTRRNSLQHSWLHKNTMCAIDKQFYSYSSKAHPSDSIFSLRGM